MKQRTDEESEPEFPTIDLARRPQWEASSSMDVDGIPNGPGEQLIYVHNHLRGESRRLLDAFDEWLENRGDLGQVEDQLKSLSSSTSFAAVGSLCSGYCELLRMHHQIEDRRLFPELNTRDDSLGPVLRTLFEEHEVIAELIASLQHLISNATQQSDRKSGSRIDRLLRHLTEQLESHLSYEEQQLCVPLNVYFQAF